MTDNSNYLPTEFQRFIHTSRYAKFIDAKRESYPCLLYTSDAADE